MSTEISRQELVARYVNAVTRNLGGRTPKDLARELESLLTESIEAREEVLGRALNLREVAGLIADFGTPEKVAGRYAPRPQCLIGPDLYPTFLVVAKVLLGVAVGLPLLLLLVSYLAPGESPELVAALFRWLEFSFRIAFGGMAWAVLVFAVLERCGVAVRYPEEDWDPLDLPPVEDVGGASRIGTGLRIYFIIALMILFNFSPGWVGIYFFSSGSDTRVVSLGDLGIQLPMLALNLWWLAALMQNLLLLKLGRWKTPIRWMEFGLGLFAAAILYHLLGIVSEAVVGEAFVAAMPNAQLATLLARLLPAVLLVLLLVLLGASAHRLYRLIRPVSRAVV
jgi:hypothetical protein